MKRIFMIPVAVLLAAMGVLTAPAEADASAPTFPSCITTKIDHDTNRYWFDPGNLTPNIRSVQIDGVNMDRRRDGIWVVDAPRSTRDVYFTYNWSKHKGDWAACRKPKPRVIR